MPQAYEPLQPKALRLLLNTLLQLLQFPGSL